MNELYAINAELAQAHHEKTKLCSKIDHLKTKRNELYKQMHPQALLKETWTAKPSLQPTANEGFCYLEAESPKMSRDFFKEAATHCTIVGVPVQFTNQEGLFTHIFHMHKLPDMVEAGYNIVLSNKVKRAIKILVARTQRIAELLEE